MRACPSSRSPRRRGGRRPPSRASGSRTPAPLNVHLPFVEHAIVEIDDPVADATPSEVLGALARSVREVHAEARVSQDLGHGIGERLVIAGWPEESRLPV